MKKRMKIFALVAAVVAIGGYGIYTNQQVDVMSDLVLANVEALAKIEDPNEGGTTTCTVSVSCTGNSSDYISCTGYFSCERKSTLFERWVKCDGIKTSC